MAGGFKKQGGRLGPPAGRRGAFAPRLAKRREVAKCRGVAWFWGLASFWGLAGFWGLALALAALAAGPAQAQMAQAQNSAEPFRQPLAISRSSQSWIPAPPAGRLVIVIDDLGHNLSAPRQLLALGLPITFSILPGLPYSAQVAAMARQNGREYLLHLPMEPVDYPVHHPGPQALLLAQPQAETRRRLARHLEQLRGAVGVNNHMGSAFTGHPDRMALVQQMIAGQGLVFLNSRTSATTVPRRIAQAHRYPYLERDVFLDNDRSLPAIRQQLYKAVALARSRGQAIAIGHPYPETLRALRELAAGMDGVALEGVELAAFTQLTGPR